jgi:hypothetical protein
MGEFLLTARPLQYKIVLIHQGREKDDTKEMEIYLNPQLLPPLTASPFSVQRGTQPPAPRCWSPADPACLEEEFILADLTLVAGGTKTHRCRSKAATQPRAGLAVGSRHRRPMTDLHPCAYAVGSEEDRGDGAFGGSAGHRDTVPNPGAAGSNQAGNGDVPNRSAAD